MTRTVSPSPEQLSELDADSGMSGDAVAQAEMVWANLPTRNLPWTSLATHEKALVCHTLARLTADALQSAQSEIARLTTVSGDMVEEMARAIAGELGVQDDGEPFVLGDDLKLEFLDQGEVDFRKVAQAAATIARGRMERLEAIAERLIELEAPAEHLPEPMSCTLLTLVDDARAALKDTL